MIIQTGNTDIKGSPELWQCRPRWQQQWW